VTTYGPVVVVITVRLPLDWSDLVELVAPFAQTYGSVELHLHTEADGEPTDYVDVELRRELPTP
jgi:hypothetical protein